MKNRLETILVDCLCDTLNVMLCSESSGAISTINSMICRYPVFNFFRARSADAMKLYFRQIRSWHCIIFDSRCSFSDEFYATVREIPLWIPVIVLTDSLPSEYIKTHIVENDYEFVISKDYSPNETGSDTDSKCVCVCPLHSLKQLFPMLQVESIRKKLMPLMMPDASVQRALDVLFTQNPLTVEDWSVVIESTPRKFQRMFKNYTNYSPKKLIALYHAYRIAFETMGKQEEYGKGVISVYFLDDRSKQRVMEYVLSRRSQLLSI